MAGLTGQALQDAIAAHKRMQAEATALKDNKLPTWNDWMVGLSTIPGISQAIGAVSNIAKYTPIIGPALGPISSTIDWLAGTKAAKVAPVAVAGTKTFLDEYRQAQKDADTPAVVPTTPAVVGGTPTAKSKGTAGGGSGGTSGGSSVGGNKLTDLVSDTTTPTTNTTNVSSIKPITPFRINPNLSATIKGALGSSGTVQAPLEKQLILERPTTGVG